MPSTVMRLARRRLARYEAKSAERELAYPWWIALASAVGHVVCAVLAVAQRDAWWPPALVASAVVLVALPFVAQYSLLTWVPWWLTSLLVISGVALLLSVPVAGAEPADFAPGVLTLLAAEITATDGPRSGLVAVVASIVLLALPWTDAATGRFSVLYIGAVLFGFVVGYMLLWQMRALRAERAARADERARATLAERQRIAREIHDLVAHSLSVTMLHVTGARRALTEDADVAEAIDALYDAERIGRRAMADIRSTVSVLATGPSEPGPLPDGADIDGLVEEARAAGLDVACTTEGDPSSLPATVGLGVFRVVQESLANAVTHAPSAPVRIDLVVDAEQVRLRVSNPVRGDLVIGQDGSGLSGMASRAAQLGGEVSAGPDRGEWVVELVLPVAADHECPVRRALP